MLENAKEGFNTKLHNEGLPYKTLCFGFDQSYAGTGIAIAGRTYDKQIDIIHFEHIGKQDTRLNFRKLLVKRTQLLLRDHRHKGYRCYALCETVRAHKDNVLNINNHLAWGALQGCLADYLYQSHDMILRVVDTRMWKSRVIGTSKPANKAPKGVDPRKWPTIRHMMHVYDIDKQQIAVKLGPRSRNYTWLAPGEDGEETKYTFNSDITDACGIAICGLIIPTRNLKQAP